MIKSRGIVSFALAAGIVMTMFSSVFAAPAWDVTGHWNPGAGETEFDWRSKPGEMEVDLSPTTPQYTTDSSDYFYKDAYGTMNQYSQKTVTFDYKGTVSKPNLIFRAPLVGGNGDYIYNFGSKMAGTMNIYNAKVMEMRINTTNALNLIFHDYDDDEYFPTINSNNKSSDLSVSLMGKTKQNVTVGSGYKGIDYSIKDSTTLKSVTVSESITTVPDNAFYNDTALCAVSLPSTITSIEYSAFYHDTALKTLGIPKSVKSIKPDAFEKSGITTINYNGTMADWGKIDIYETHLDRFDNPYISFDGLLTDHAITVKCTDGDIILPVRSRNNESYSGSRGYVAQTGGKPGFEWYINGGVTTVNVGADSSTIPYTSMDEFLDK
ncbi:MAG: leucine-rich repeat domain-containing protein, partial [Clostridiales bacterium]|nr:leucine-rich repeat domain-containing protein [Clostridiales bacterium]